jgi:hypothetical protein
MPFRANRPSPTIPSEPPVLAKKPSNAKKRLRIALVTSEKFPGENWKDADLPIKRDRLRARGHHVDIVTWDGNRITDAQEEVEEGHQVDWKGYDRVEASSLWSGWRDLHGFVRWVVERGRDEAEGGPRLLNQKELLLMGWNKRYLGQLGPHRDGNVSDAARSASAARQADFEVPVVDTYFVEIGSEVPDPVFDELTPAALHDIERDGETNNEHPRDADRNFLPKYVAKAVSGGATLDTIVSTDRSEIREFVKKIHAGNENVGSPPQAAIVQPYLPSIDRDGEINVIVLDGKVRYAIRKDPILKGRVFGDGKGDTDFHPNPEIIAMSDEQVAFVQKTYEAFLDRCVKMPPGQRPYQLRFDFIPVIRPDGTHEWKLLETEIGGPVKHFHLLEKYIEKVKADPSAALEHVDVNAIDDLITEIERDPDYLAVETRAASKDLAHTAAAALDLGGPL